MSSTFYSSHPHSKISTFLRSNEKHKHVATLGAIDQWPIALQIAFNLALYSTSPRFIAWGPNLITLYNDACLTIFGEVYSTNLGRPLAELWQDQWSELKPAFDQALNGTPVYSLELPLSVHGQNVIGTNHSNLSLVPIYEGNSIVGVHCELAEATTNRVVEYNPFHEVERLMQLFEHSPGMVIFFQSANHIFAGANYSFHQHMGCNELLGHPSHEVIVDSSNHGFQALLDEVFATGKPYRGKEVPLQFCRDPKQQIVDFIIQPIVNSDGSHWGVFVEAFDVTDRLQATIKLQESEQRLRQLADTIPQLAWMADETGAIHWYNKRWYDYTGTTPDEMEGWGWQQVHHPIELPKVLETWKGSLASGEPFEMTFPLRGKDGSFRPFFTLVEPLRNSEGKIVQWFGTNTDVSNLYRAQDELRKTEALLEEGLSTGRMVVWEWNLRKQSVKYSDNSKDVLGYSTSDPSVGWLSIHPSDVERLKKAIDRAIAERNQFCELTQRIRPDTGEGLWVETRGSVVLDSHGEPEFIRGIMIDLTDRINAENELKETNHRKDEFLAMLAHELRNPLAPISTSAQILKIPNIDDANVKHASDTISRQVKHMTDLIDDLMDVSRVTRGLVQLQSENVDLKSVIANAIEQARPLIAARYQTLATVLADPEIFVRGDATRLIQVVSNVLNNAAKYTPEAGHISLNLNINKSEAIITVTDNGIGIQPSLLPHIFDLFTQADRSPDRSQGGLGLGLTLVKKITSMHGGHVMAHSNGQGLGSTFTIALPKLSSLNIDSAPDNALRPNTGTAVKLMIVDDNVDAAESLAAFLTAKGHNVITRPDALSTLEFAEKKSIQIFILDIGLPDMDGYQLVKNLKANPQTANAIFIALTGYGQPRDRAMSAAAGFDHHFVKPIDIQKLVNLLEQFTLT